MSDLNGVLTQEHWRLFSTLQMQPSDQSVLFLFTLIKKTTNETLKKKAEFAFCDLICDLIL